MNLRRKIVSIGLSAVTAGTFAFTVAAPAAHANIVTDVCNLLPGLNATAIGNVTGAGANASVKSADLATKLSELNAATVAFTTALVDHLVALGAGTSTVVTQAVLNGAQADLSNKFVAWANADAANYTAQQALQAAIMQSNIISGLGALPCP
jgi:hypothetical protein